MRRRRTRLIFLLAMLLGSPMVANAQPTIRAEGEAPTHSQRADATTPAVDLRIFRSKHYLIHTNLTREETVPFGRHMDAVFEQYERRFSDFVGEELAPMPLYLLRTREQYLAFLGEHDIDASNSGGLFFITHELQGLATWAETDNHARTLRVLQHEGFHQFAWHYIGPNLPVWVNEGLAQYFEDSVLVGDRMSLGITNLSRIDRVKDALQRGAALRLDRLAAVSEAQWNRTLRDNPETAAMLYAQSWSTVYYMIHGEDGRWRREFVDYLKLIGQGNQADQAARLAFGRTGFASVEAGWREYAADQTPDDVAVAAERLEFLGTGLRLLSQGGRPMPDTMDELQDTLQNSAFHLRRREMGVTRNLSAQDDELFHFPRDSETGNSFEAEFVLLAPAANDLPPRIVAPGLSPEPTLIWYRDDEGNLVQQIEYR